MQVQRHTVEHVADGAPCLPTLDVPVPQKVDQPVNILKIIAKLSPAVEEQVIDVPKIIQDPTPAALGAFGASAAGGTAGGSASAHDHGTVRGHCRPHVVLALTAGWEVHVVAGGYKPPPGDPPGGDHRQPRAVFQYWARMRIFYGPLCSWQLLVRCWFA